MPVNEIGDPRLQALFGATDPREAGVRPTVRLPRKGLPPIVLVLAALGLALLLFSLLSARRTRQEQPPVQTRAADNAASGWAPPPPLYIPPVPQPVAPISGADSQAERPAPPAPAPAESVRVVAPAAPAVQPIVQLAPATAPAPQLPHQRTSAGSPLVIDTGIAQAVAAAPGTSASAGSDDRSGQVAARVRASAFANRSMTVPQGYLIPAVLETGFDSTKPGFARAIVSRDVRGFDGRNVLIPRGSRLIGEYKSIVAQGQNRAVIDWTRLIRPDGMTIAMDSPGVDTVGRGGVAARVNTHFFSRLGDALLQSTFQIGQFFAGRAVAGPVVVLPGNVASAATQAAAPSTNYVPTLKVAPGKSISVFVAQDLDFSAAGWAR